MKNKSFQSLVQGFFLERLMTQVNASSCTISAYRDTFRLFFDTWRNSNTVPRRK